MDRWAVLGRIVLGACAVSMCFLAFVWPYVISSDKADARFRIVAVTAFLAFFVALAVVLACKAHRT